MKSLDFRMKLSDFLLKSLDFPGLTILAFQKCIFEPLQLSHDFDYFCKEKQYKTECVFEGGDQVENWALRYGHIFDARIQRVRMCPKLKAQRNQ